MDNTTLHQLKEMLEKAHSIAIFGHRNIDGDCIGSALGIGTLLTNQGKIVSYFTPDQPMSDRSFIEKAALFQTQFDYTNSYDLLLFVDSGNNTSQLKDFWTAHPDYFTAHTQKVVIDHHESNPGYGDLNMIDTQASSACELIAEILFVLYPEQMTTEIATYLFMGISTDTGHFFYDNDYARTFSIASKLLSYGIDKKDLINKLYRNNTLEQVQFTGHLIERICKDNHVVYTRFSHHELEKRGLDGQHIEHILPVMTSIDHAGVFLFFKGNEHDPLEPHLRCSLRTKNPDINLAVLASQFNGGGHPMSAGARISLDGKTVAQTIQHVVARVNAIISEDTLK